MAADAIVSRELKSLHEELAASQRERAPAPPPPPPPSSPTANPDLADDTVQERELREQMRELANEATKFFEDAEKNIVAHPAESVIGALLLGILIGRFLGRR